MKDESSQAAVMPSESLHDILKCELEEENEKLLQSGHCTTFHNQSEVGETAREGEVEDSQFSHGVLEVSREMTRTRERERERKPTQSAWSQTCSKHHTVKIDLSRRSDTSQAGNKKVTLVRGSSLSLVDLPTFLPPLPLEVTKNIPIISSLSNNQHPFNKVGTQDILIALSFESAFLPNQIDFRVEPVLIVQNLSRYLISLGQLVHNLDIIQLISMLTTSLESSPLNYGL